MNNKYGLLLLVLGFSFTSLNALAQDDPKYITPPAVEMDINSVDLLSGRYEAELPELSIPAAPRLSFKYLQQFVVRAEGTTYLNGGPTIYDFTYQGNTSERFKCTSGECIPEENYGSTLTGGFMNTSLQSVIAPPVVTLPGTPPPVVVGLAAVQPGSVQYRQGQTGIRYVYSSKAYFATSGVSQVGHWWASQILYPDGETLTFSNGIGSGTTTPTFNKPHRPQKVTSNTGYEIRFTYVSDVWTNISETWYQLKTAEIYKTSGAVLLAKFTYSISGAETTVTDLENRVWKYSGYQNTPGVLPVTAVTSNFKLRLLTNTFDSVSTTRYPSGTSQGLVSQVVRNGLTYNYTYSGVQSNGNGKIFSGLTITGPSNYQRTLTYGTWGQGHAKQPYVISDKNSVGKITSYIYVGRRIQTVTYPEGNKVTYTYDGKGNVLTMRAIKKTGASNPDIVNKAAYLSCLPGSSPTVRCFKPLNSTDGNNKITTYTFADHGGLEEAVGPAGTSSYKRVTRNVWAQASGSGLWRLDNSKACFWHECNTSSSNVRITSYTYWGATNLPLTVTTKSSASASSSVTTYSYDEAGRVLSVNGPLSGTGDAVYYRYDDAGRQTWEIGAVNGNSKRVAKRLTLRSQDSQPTKIETGSITSATATVLTVDTTQNMTYTTHGLPTTIKILGGTTTHQFKQITYDTRNRVSCETQRMNPTKFSTPPASACTLGVSGIYGADRITKYDYDSESRTTKVTSGYGTVDEGIDRQTTYTNNGQVSTLLDGKGNTTTYQYDGHDRLIRVTFPNGKYELYTYDNNGNKLSWRKRDGATFSYVYDVTNQLKTTTVPGETAINYIYDGAGRPKEVNRGTSNKTEYGYDDRGFLSSYKTNGSLVTYVNDAAGRRTSMTYPSGQIITYAYDGTGAVTDIDARQSAGASLMAIADYTYNNMGRLTSVALSGGATTTYGYGALGRLSNHTLTNFNTTTFAYNPASQMVMRTVTSASKQTLLPTSTPTAYVVNNLNQYSSAGGNTLSYNDNGNLTAYKGWSYAYDAHNRLTTASKTGTSSVTLGYDPGGNLISNKLGTVTTNYVYSGDQLIGEYTSTGTPINLYIYPPNSDIPIARFSGSSGLTDIKHLRGDERGSIVAETVGTTSVESHQYDVYGVPSNTSNSLFRYTGQIQLKGTELYHYKARAYHPGLGRFLQTDPIGYDDGMNMYAYVGNDPLNNTDPTGMIIDTIADIAFIAYDVYKIVTEGATAVNMAALGADAAGAVIPGATGLGVGVRSAHATEQVAKAVNGNSKASTKLQHRYEISDKTTGDVKKTGISGRDLNKDGSSPRANSQVNALNKAEGTDKFEASVKETNISGRQAALESEQVATNRLSSDGHSLERQCRPKPGGSC